MTSILVVDDEERVRTLLCEILAEEYACDVVTTAEEALGQLKAQNYEVVITDISMPGMSGLELLGQIRKSQPDTPVIVISGISDLEYVKGLIDMGAYDYISKPFKLEAVEKTVASAVEHYSRLLEKRAASQPDKKTSSDDAAFQEIGDLEHDWIEAYIKRDLAVFERIWSDDFSMTNPFGQIRGRQQVIENIRENLFLEFFTTFDVHGNIFDNTAVVTGRAIIKGRFKGEDLTGQYRYTDTYAKRDGKWQAIATHVTRIEQ